MNVARRNRPISRAKTTDLIRNSDVKRADIVESPDEPETGVSETPPPSAFAVRVWFPAGGEFARRSFEVALGIRSSKTSS